MPRKYEMKRRAERIHETRRRIAQAAMELHETVGPARTTVSAIAEKAGVQRHTYYAHFPKLKDLYEACTAHHMEQAPLPDPSRWAEISGPEERLRRALSEVYAYYESNEALLTNVLFYRPPSQRGSADETVQQVHCSPAPIQTRWRSAAPYATCTGSGCSVPRYRKDGKSRAILMTSLQREAPPSSRDPAMLPGPSGW